MATKKGRLTTSLRSVITPRYLDAENILDVSGVDATGNNSALGWAIYKDSVSERPVDGTGGSPTIVQPVTVTTVTPLSKGRSLLFQKNSGNAQGEGWSVDFRIDRVHLAKVLQIEFDYQVESGTFVAGTTNNYTTAGDSDLIVYIYDVDNNKLIEPTTFRLYSNSSNIADLFVGNFQTSADGLNYRLIFHVARNSTAAWTLKIDNVTVKPAKYTYGTPITDWVDFPSVAAGTLITAAHNTSPVNPTYGTVVYNRAQWRRVGGEMEIRWVYKQQGSPAGTAGNGMYLFNLPPGYQIDVNRLSPAMPNTGTAAMDFGYIPNSLFVALDIGSPTHGIGAASMYSTTQLKMYFQAAGPGGSGVNYWHSGYFPFSIANNIFSLFASIPIVGWSSSVKIAEPMELRDVYCRVRKTSSQTISASWTKVTFNQVLTDLTNSFNLTNNEFVVPTSGIYLIEYSVDSGGDLALAVFVNGVNSGSFSAVGGGQFCTLLSLRAGDVVDIRAYMFSSPTTITELTVGPQYLNITRLPSSQALAQSEQVVGYVYKTSSQSIPNNISTVLTDFIKDQDTHNAMNATSGIITAPKSGYLTLNAGALFAASSSGDIREIQVQINSTIVARSAVARRSDNTAHATISITGIRVNSGDQITVRVLQNSGAALNITGTSDRYNFISWKIE